MKRLIAVLLLLCVLFSGCTPSGDTQKQYTATFLTLFDTVTSIVGRAESEEAFTEKAQAVHDALLEYHRLFDIYHEYDGIANLKTVNDSAGDAPVQVDKRIIRMLLDAKTYYEFTGEKVNIAMGSVLALWHEARTSGINDPVNAKLPDDAALKSAAQHTDFNAVVIDEEASTVFITDPLVQLDVGAVAKGWAVQQVAENSPSGLLISVGGNVCATGPKDENNTPWVVGIQDPHGGEEYLHTLYVRHECVVTSGDYQRTYMVDGKLYHHIIDPDTLYPSDYWSAVTVVCTDSGAADALSTALFLLPYEQGLELLGAYNAEALWVEHDGSILYSDGFEALIRT